MVKLSASRISTALKCSLLYYFKYIVKTPDPSNSGASRGSCVHYILENLLRPDRKYLVEKILEEKDPFVIPHVKRMAEIWARKLDVFNPEDMEMIRKFILTALKVDFYHDGAESVEAEYEFNVEGPNWKAGGFIDKTAVYKDRVEIVDYKSSKKKFDKKELGFNLQNFFYVYAAQQRFPDLPVSLQFHFLKFEKDPVQVAPPITKEEMDGFLAWCGHISDYLDDFSKEKAYSNLAKSDISTRWLCGTAKYPGEMKKDGSGPVWSCGSRFPYIYFALEENGKVIISDKDKSVLEKKQKEGQVIVEKKHLGCPAWSYLWESKN